MQFGVGKRLLSHPVHSAWPQNSQIRGGMKGWGWHFCLVAQRGQNDPINQGNGLQQEEDTVPVSYPSSARRDR